MNGLAEVLLRAAALLPEPKKTTLRPLFSTELHQQLAERLAWLHQRNGDCPQPGPQLEAETTPPLQEVFEPFVAVLKTWVDRGPQAEPEVIQGLVGVFTTIDTASLLVLLGLRTTPGSVVDEQAFPPPRQELLKSAQAPFEASGGLSCTARALSKHSPRAGDAFWGKVSGPVAQQNQAAQKLIERILKEKTWWNVFSHFQHGLIYEARLESGHGARWTKDGHVFIGFVDPFDVSQRQDGGGTVATDAERPQAELEAQFGPMPDKLDRDELQKRFAAGQRSFHGVNLAGANLSNLDLRGIDLTGSYLMRVKLYQTHLEGANLTECDLTGTYLVNTHCSGLVARRARFAECRLDGVKWEKLDLEGARFDSANLQKAELRQCRMKRVGFVGADLTGATLNNCRLHGAYLSETCLQGILMQYCGFDRANLSKADLTRSTLEHCNFDNADLSGANFTGATINTTHFIESNLTAADFSAVKLEKNQLDGAQMARVNLSNCTANKVSFTRTNLSQSNLRGARLEDTLFEQADLSRSDLREANLKGANLSGADLTGADVVGTVVDARTNFRAAKTINVDFSTNWAVRQRVVESAHELTIQQFREAHPILGFFWWAMLGCGQRPGRLLYWGIAIVFIFAGLMAARPESFTFKEQNPTFLDHLCNSLALFVTLDLGIDKGVDQYGRMVMLAQMLLSYLMLGFMASLFSSIFPNPPE